MSEIADRPIIIRGEDAQRLIKAIDAEVMLVLSKNDKGEVEIDWDNF
jgi:hypothetical protein